MSWWRTGTLAVAGTIPVRSVTASATLARSEGHHPAGYRTAIPTRVYESGSGAAAAAHAVPVRHPFPARPPPRQENTGPPMPRTPDHRLAGPGVKGACGVAARALRAPGPRPPARATWQRSRAMGPGRHAEPV